MIIVTQVVRDGNNTDNAIFTISYDVNGVSQVDIYMDYPMEDIVVDTPAEIKQKIVYFVAVERGDALWTQVLSKVTPYIGQDLEP